MQPSCRRRFSKRYVNRGNRLILNVRQQEFRGVAFELNRIDGTLSLASLRSSNFSFDDDGAMIELPISANHFIELYLPVVNGSIEARWLEVARDLMTRLTEMDNQIQRASAEAWKASGQKLPGSYYEGELALIRFTGADEAELRYTVIACNSEWGERFVRTDGSWVRKT